jgi:predicted metal-dependent enzyme (double-stranded beta helix superfamily)
LKLKILTDEEKTNFFTIGTVVFAPGTQTHATELKNGPLVYELRAFNDIACVADNITVRFL